jgi:hypothetical protein
MADRIEALWKDHLPVVNAGRSLETPSRPPPRNPAPVTR